MLLMSLVKKKMLVLFYLSKTIIWVSELDPFSSSWAQVRLEHTFLFSCIASVLISLVIFVIGF